MGKSASVTRSAALSLLVALAGCHTAGVRPAETSRAAKPGDKSADYIVTFFNTTANTINLSRSSFTCMYNPGNPSIALTPKVPATESLEDRNSGLDCLNSTKLVVWTVLGTGGSVTYRHELESGVGSSWLTTIVDSSNWVQSAYCLTGNSETPQDCLNKGVENVVGIDITF